MASPLAAEEAIAEFGPSAERLAVTVASLAAVWVVGRYLIVPAVVRMVRRRNPDNPTMVEAIRRYTTLLVVVGAVAVAVTVAGYGDLLAGSALLVAAITLAIGVAGQEVIGNLVSGFFLVADPEFNVGDWIEWEDGQGTVETIRFRVTRVRTQSNEVITVPNTTLATGAFRRPYSRDRVRVVLRVGISHDEEIDRAAAVLREGFDAVEAALADPPPEVIVDEFEDDALRLRAQFWVGEPTRIKVNRARSTYVERVHERLRAEGIAFSPPSDHALTGSIEVSRPREESAPDRRR